MNKTKYWQVENETFKKRRTGTLYFDVGSYKTDSKSLK